MIDRRTFLRSLAACAALPVLSGCSGGTETVDDSDENLADTLLYCIRTPSSLDPALADDAGHIVTSQLFDTLLRYDFTAHELVPCAATSYEVGEGATSVTFKLALGAAFHNGDQVTSQDFKRAWERVVRLSRGAVVGKTMDDKERESYAPGYLLAAVKGYKELKEGKTDELAGVSCPDDATLRVELSMPYADFPYIVTHPALVPVPASALEDEEAFALEPTGNGPFKLAKRWDGKEDIHLVRAGDTADASTLGSVLFVMEKDASAAYRKLEAGDVDVADVPAEQLAAVKDAEENVLSSVDLSCYYLVCNTAKPPFDDVDFRRALSLAIDLASLVEKVMRGAAAPATSVVSPAVVGEDADVWPYCVYDEEGAKAFLEPMFPADEDGNRDIEISLATSQGGLNTKVMERVAKDLKAVGISVKLETSDWEDLVDSYRDGDFECGRMSRTMDFPSADSVLHPLFHSGSAGVGNYARYANESVDKALDEARATADEAARRDLLARVNAQVGKDCPVIPLMFGMRTVAASDRVADLAVDARGIPLLDAVKLS